MGKDKDFIRTLLDTYKAISNSTLKRLNLETLKRDLKMYDLSANERREFGEEIDNMLREIGALSSTISRGEVKGERGREEEEGEEEKISPEAKLIELISSLKTNPDGIAKALEAALPEEKKVFFADLIRKRLEERAGTEAIDWASNVVSWQKGCERAMGVPMFRTRYLKQRFEDPEHPGKYMVLGVCYSPKTRYKSQWFNNVPIEDIERLERE